MSIPVLKVVISGYKVEWLEFMPNDGFHVDYVEIFKYDNTPIAELKKYLE